MFIHGEKKKKKAHRCEFWRTGYNICFRCTHIWHVFTSFCQFRRDAHFIRTPFPRGALVPFSSLGTIESHLPRTRNRIVCSVGTHTTFQGVLFPKRNRYHPKQHMPRFIFLTYVLFSSFFFFFFLHRSICRTVGNVLIPNCKCTARLTFGVNFTSPTRSLMRQMKSKIWVSKQAHLNASPTLHAFGRLSLFLSMKFASPW